MSDDKNSNTGIRISLEEAKDRYDRDEPLVLDVVQPNSREDYGAQVKGAIHIDPDQIESVYQQLPEDRSILAYCT